MIDRLARKVGTRFGRPGAHLAAEIADLALLGPLLFARQRRDRTGSALRGSIRSTWYEQLWTTAASEVGATLTAGPGRLLTVRRGDRSTRLWGHFVALDDPVTLQLVGDKPAVHDLLTRHGLRAPDHVVVGLDQPQAAIDLIDRHGQVVVKPAAGTGAGSGVTGGVRTATDVDRALVRSARHDTARALVEAQVVGREIRVLVVHGEPLAIVERRPPQLRGDGRSSVVELVQIENRRRVTAAGNAGLFPLELDLDAALTLQHAGLSFSSVLGAGHALDVKSSTSQGSERDASARAVDDLAFAGVVADAVAAAGALGTACASVEFITPDPSASTAETGVVLEVNTTPGIAQHHLVDNAGTTPHTAALVLERLLSGPRL